MSEIEYTDMEWAAAMRDLKLFLRQKIDHGKPAAIRNATTPEPVLITDPTLILQLTTIKNKEFIPVPEWVSQPKIEHTEPILQITDPTPILHLSSNEPTSISEQEIEHTEPILQTTDPTPILQLSSNEPTSVSEQEIGYTEPRAQPGLSPKEKRILNYIEKNPTKTKVDMIAELGDGTTTINRIVVSLIQKGKIIQTAERLVVS